MIQKSNLDYSEATHIKIIRPQLARKGKSFDSWITCKSPKWQRLAVVQLTRYLSIECDYRQDLCEFSSVWMENKTASFSMVDSITLKNGEEREALIGIITFHEFNSIPTLYHCYLHPFYRKGKGDLMKEAWISIQARYPKFEIEPPISQSFKGFIKKSNHSHVQNLQMIGLANR